MRHSAYALSAEALKCFRRELTLGADSLPRRRRARSCLRAPSPARLAMAARSAKFHDRRAQRCVVGARRTLRTARATPRRPSAYRRARSARCLSVARRSPPAASRCAPPASRMRPRRRAARRTRRPDHSRERRRPPVRHQRTASRGRREGRGESRARGFFKRLRQAPLHPACKRSHMRRWSLVSAERAAASTVTWRCRRCARSAASKRISCSRARAPDLELETEMTAEDFEALADVVHRDDDLAAAISSGSFLTDGMLVIPCSMKSASAIAYSMNDEPAGARGRRLSEGEAAAGPGRARIAAASGAFPHARATGGEPAR